MTPHEIVIRFGRPFDIQTPAGGWLGSVREITVPFADRESAEGAQREVEVFVRPVHDAGGEDYRPVVAGEVVRTDSASRRPRLRACVERWPDCFTGDYNPACCRFPKSCSADIYDGVGIDPAGLEGDANA
jgi:hypothetical protein